jgi:hypothetical protein
MVNMTRVACTGTSTMRKIGRRMNRAAISIASA